MSGAYYNEIEPYAAQWLRNLIAAGHIAPGEVDERSIEDVHPDDLRSFTQCHFFAGIGIWSHALRRAGWPDDRPVWTGSCPCQPFSQAGAGAGFDDERHLWPHFHWLIQECGPAIVLGEQVASKDADAWIDLVQDDLEGLGYGVGAVPFPAAGVGAPHIRDRLYWMAYADRHGRKSRCQGGKAMGHRAAAESDSGAGRLGDTHYPRLEGGPTRAAAEGPGTSLPGVNSGLADAAGERRLRRERVSGRRINDRTYAGRIKGDDGSFSELQAGVLPSFGMADADGGDASAERQQHGRQFGLHQEDGGNSGQADKGSRLGTAAHTPVSGPVNGFWRDADWISCRDGKFRPVEPKSFPLVVGATQRVGRLRAYGNGICAPAAAEFCAIALDFFAQ